MAINCTLQSHEASCKYPGLQFRTIIMHLKSPRSQDPASRAVLLLKQIDSAASIGWKKPKLSKKGKVSNSNEMCLPHMSHCHHGFRANVGPPTHPGSHAVLRGPTLDISFGVGLQGAPPESCTPDQSLQPKRSGLWSAARSTTAQMRDLRMLPRSHGHEQHLKTGQQY